MGKMELMKVGGTEMALDLPKTQTFDEWLEVGRGLASANKVLNWWIGDWWAAGSHRYGERAKVAAEGIFGREFQTLVNLGNISAKFESNRRRLDVSWSHHAEVAALPAPEADELLERAARDNWTVRDIRAEAAAVRLTASSATAPSARSTAAGREWSLLVGAWNRSSVETRERFLSEMDGTAPILE